MSKYKGRRFGAAGLAMAFLVLSVPAGADVRAGVDAWARGDYAAAVAQWRPLADAGDADALFNMGQAYRLGRGVPVDMVRARDFYEAAARAGHVQAADTYGLMLFQDGEREKALPYVRAAAERGDPRARYLLGIAHFNGDLVEHDWERAYALLTLANGAGLPQAATAIAQMDEHIALEQREAGAALAVELERQAMEARSVQLAAADLAVQQPVIADPRPRPASAPATVPRAIPTVEVSPSVAAARDAVEQARQATGGEDPQLAGASYAGRGPATASRPQVATAAAVPQPVANTTRPVPASVPTTAPVPASRSSGPWRVQLGAFGVPGNAERLWSRVSNRPEVAGRERLLLPTGRVTRLQAGGYATRSQAQEACSSLQRAGFECLVTRN